MRAKGLYSALPWKTHLRAIVILLPRLREML
jgi:hypothetical protein